MNRFGLIGHPLGHSFSQAYFNKKYAREKIDACYENFDLSDIQQLPGMLREHPDWCGFNVTSPYKEAIIPYLDFLDIDAEAVGAVNTVKVLENSKLKGFNTDVIGIEISLFGTEATNSSLRGEIATKQSTVYECGLLRFARNDEFAIAPRNDGGAKALILGTGGASKAVQYVLKKRNLPYHLVSRDPNKGHFTYETLSTEIIKEHKLIINATPLGMAPDIDEAPDIPYEAITSRHILFDLIYNPDETLFLKRGKEHGAQTINGFSMLYTQAEASWMIWNQ